MLATTKKQLIKDLIEQSWRDIWAKEIAIAYYAKNQTEESLKNKLAAEMELKECQSKLVFFEELYENYGDDDSGSIGKVQAVQS